jgi:hypothetical protein
MATAVVPAVGIASAASAATTPRRRFRLIDAMILVAATALGCFITVSIVREQCLSGGWSIGLDEGGDQVSGGGINQAAVEDLLLVGTLGIAWLSFPFFAIWTLAMIPLRFISPRPRLRRMVRQPGAMAMIAAGVGIAIAGIHVATIFVALGSGVLGDSVLIMVVMGGAMSYPGLAVFVTWMTLLAGRRWRAEREWVDRLGRVFGAYWIAEAIALPVSYMFWVRMGG